MSENIHDPKWIKAQLASTREGAAELIRTVIAQPHQAEELVGWRIRELEMEHLDMEDRAVVMTMWAGAAFRGLGDFIRAGVLTVQSNGGGDSFRKKV
jgi:hypothetical protein